MEGASGDIFVISDLHLGDGGMRDNFEAGSKTRHLHAFLDHVGSEGGRLFILGDLFELWQMNISRLFLKRLPVLDHFARLPLVYVPGNHDIDLAAFVGTDFLRHPFFGQMRPPFTEVLGGRRFHFLHGHEVDPFNSGDQPGFGRMLSIFAGIFEDRNGSPLLEDGKPVAAVLEQFGDSMLMLWTCAMSAIQRSVSGKDVSPGDALTPAQDPGRLLEHVRQVRADLERDGNDVAVLGHTHRPGRISNWYFNSGSWTGPSNPFLRISPDGHVRHLEWCDGRALERDMPLVLPDASPDQSRARAKNPFKVAASAARTFFPKPEKPDRARWFLLLQGGLAIGVGVGALVASASRGSAAGLQILVSAFGIYALIDGLLSLLSARREQPVKRLLQRVRGAASILLGFVVLHRSDTVDILMIFIGVWAFITGALRVGAAVIFRGMLESRWLILVGGGSMIGGFLLLFLTPPQALVKLTISGYLCMYGVGEILAGLFGRGAYWSIRRRRRFLASEPGSPAESIDAGGARPPWSRAPSDDAP